MNKQLPLDLAFNKLVPTLDNFYDVNNAGIVAHLKSLLHKEHYETLTHLWGPPGCGRTHLLQACCHQGRELKLLTCYVSLKHWQERRQSPALLYGLEHCYLLALDDLDAILGHADWEQAMIDLYHRMQEQQHCLLVSSEPSIGTINSMLTDLRSRLQGGATFRLHPLDDQQKQHILQSYAQHYGLELSHTTAQFLLNHYPRNLLTLLLYLEQLNQAAWAEKRRITIPFIKEHRHIELNR